MEPVQSTLSKQLQADTETEAKFDAARKLVAKQLAFQKSLREGKLTREQFDRMPTDYKTVYRQHFGVPKTKAEVTAAQRSLAARRKASKSASKARKATRKGR
jgi:hypothetical protein